MKEKIIERIKSFGTELNLTENEKDLLPWIAGIVALLLAHMLFKK